MTLGAGAAAGLVRGTQHSVLVLMNPVYCGVRRNRYHMIQAIIQTGAFTTPCYGKSRNNLFVHSRYTVMIPSGIPKKKPSKGVRPSPWRASGSNAPCKGPNVPIHSCEQLFSIDSQFKKY
jgi:hypothetical protein